ncbi:phosphoglycerate dehydrogenase-like enzyme [Friedmanniella endophytica]|uniref:Phosphoglycerate dehydrogenase-like enzyme n=1 Tax=Microlunatus kandeliicorticis TaxID=1759536 RepID=A0A7W3IR16_9ACTN|nr:hydroxyacid dehydrogenase [Microlunatus kandeliicorticis]MBA8793684.1 phosphoglycerate dehydrogenase-like enzyme [Microlunatus kandeliicorticis]
MILIAMAEPMLSRFFDPERRARLAALGEVRLAPTPTDLLDPATSVLLPDTEVIITGWGSGRVGPEVLDLAPRLRAVVHSAGSVRAFADPVCYDRGVVISSQAWANALPVAEYTLAVILLAAKRVPELTRAYRERRRRPDNHAFLGERGGYGARVGLIGASMVGRRVIELLAPFDLRVSLADPTLTPADAERLGVTLVDLDTLMRDNDVVSLHAPWLPSTEGMIGARELALLPDGATFVNTARGALVDEAALITELERGRIEAVLDVTWPEPPADDSPLWSLPNVTLTPHLAGAAGNELRRLGASAVDEVARALAGDPLVHAVSRERYDTVA